MVVSFDKVEFALASEREFKRMMTSQGISRCLTPSDWMLKLEEDAAC